MNVCVGVCVCSINRTRHSILFPLNFFLDPPTSPRPPATHTIIQLHLSTRNICFLMSLIASGISKHTLHSAVNSDFRPAIRPNRDPPPRLSNRSLACSLTHSLTTRPHLPPSLPLRVIQLLRQLLKLPRWFLASNSN